MLVKNTLELQMCHNTVSGNTLIKVFEYLEKMRNVYVKVLFELSSVWLRYLDWIVAARILGSSNSSKSLGFLLDWHKEEWNIFALKMEKMDFLLIDKKRQRLRWCSSSSGGEEDRPA